MKTIRHLKAQKDRLKAIMQIMDSEASFESEDGRKYAQALVKLVLINMQIEEIEKEAARK